MEVTNNLSLNALGWSDLFAEALSALGDTELVPARIAVEHRGLYVAYGDRSATEARITGRFRHRAADARDLPAVGDWVVLRAQETPEDPLIVQAVLPRRTAFVRGSAGHELEPQVVAANVDRVLITSSMDADCNPRRLERYLALVHESGAEAVIVLTKLDLCDDPEPYLRIAREIAGDVPTFVVSNETGEGITELRETFGLNETVALVGSSGVGKSSLVNRFLGFERQAIAETRDGGKGKHTTIRRELIAMPGGGLLLDTPGMRELQLWDGLDGLLAAFPEIHDLMGA
ncbi:MAG: ribosome small subunit-dependent GTPase A, partial [Acidimicrobiales bacterium]